MLLRIREGVGRTIIIVILGLIAISFIFWGVDFNLAGPTYAAKVNGEEIPLQEFERYLQAEQAQFLELYRVELDRDLRRQLRASVIDRLVAQRALSQRVEEAGYRASDERVAEAIMSVPMFQVGGQFSREAYRGQLAMQGMSPRGFEELQREQIQLQDLETGFVRSAFVTPEEYRRYVELANQRRQIAYASFDVEMFLDQVEITDDDIAAHYEQNADRYMTEEAVELEYVELARADIAQGIEISEEELHDYYDRQASQFRTEPERRASHILLTPADDEARARADELLARIREGESFETLAAEYSDDPGSAAAGGDLGWISRGMLAGEFEDTLYSMDVGEIEGPVRTDFGWHLIRLDAIREGEERAFEDIRDELLVELRNERADDLYFSRANQLGDLAFDEFDSLDRVAEQLGLPLKHVERFPRSGDRTVFPNSTPVTDAVFGFNPLDIGINSDLIELSDDHVVVVRVVERFPPEQRPLDEVADEIRTALTRARAEQLAADAAAAFADALPETLTAEFIGAVSSGADATETGAEQDAGEAADAAGSLDGAAQAAENDANGAAAPDDAESEPASPAARLAAEHGGMWHGPLWIERTAANVPTEVVAAAFDLGQPEAGEHLQSPVSMSSGDRALIVLSAVEPGNPEAVSADRRVALQQQLLRAATNAELGSYGSSVQQRAKVRVPPDILEPSF